MRLPDSHLVRIPHRAVLGQRPSGRRTHFTILKDYLDLPSFNLPILRETFRIVPRCLFGSDRFFKDGSGVEDLFVWIAKTVSQKGDEADNDSYDPDDDRVELRQVEPEEIETKKYNCCKST